MDKVSHSKDRSNKLAIAIRRIASFGRKMTFVQTWHSVWNASFGNRPRDAFLAECEISGCDLFLPKESFLAE